MSHRSPLSWQLLLHRGLLVNAAVGGDDVGPLDPIVHLHPVHPHRKDIKKGSLQRLMCHGAGSGLAGDKDDSSGRDELAGWHFQGTAGH